MFTFHSMFMSWTSQLCSITINWKMGENGRFRIKRQKDRERRENIFQFKSVVHEITFFLVDKLKSIGMKTRINFCEANWAHQQNYQREHTFKHWTWLNTFNFMLKPKGSNIHQTFFSYCNSILSILYCISFMWCQK